MSDKSYSLASAFLPVVNFVSPASVFRHQAQSSTAGHGLVRNCQLYKLGMIGGSPYAERVKGFWDEYEKRFWGGGGSAWGAPTHPRNGYQGGCIGGQSYFVR
jgi:hypothetical protein